MGINDILDEAIKKQEMPDKAESGYEINGRLYRNYVDNDSWNKFLNDMKLNYPEAYKAYEDGNGDELGLKENSTKPPKMASFGSSSRMIFHLSKQIESFKFEKKLPTTIGGVANLDGFMETEERVVFVEAKCREPYSNHKDNISTKYQDFYEYLNERSELTFKTKCDRLNDNKMYVDFVLKDQVIECFDLKQMLCHLLGIATMLLKEPTQKEIKFVYLLFNPTVLPIENIKAEEIYEKYHLCCKECKVIDFSKVFATICEYLQEKKGVGKASYDEIEMMVNNFTFTLCDQTNFCDVVR